VKKVEKGNIYVAFFIRHGNPPLPSFDLTFASWNASFYFAPRAGWQSEEDKFPGDRRLLNYNYEIANNTWNDALTSGLRFLKGVTQIASNVRWYKRFSKLFNSCRCLSLLLICITVFNTVSELLFNRKTTMK